MPKAEPHDPGVEPARKRSEEAGDAAHTPVQIGEGKVRFGTASWTDPTMTAPGVFYPRGADSAEERLRFYASQFPVVEVDATYYALPNKRTAVSWVEPDPGGFSSGRWVKGKKRGGRRKILRERQGPVGGGRGAAGLQELRASSDRADEPRARGVSVPRTQRRELGEEGHRAVGEIPLPLRPRRAGRLDAKDSRGGEEDEGDARRLQQLLLQLRDD